MMLSRESPAKIGLLIRSTKDVKNEVVVIVRVDLVMVMVRKVVV